MNLRIARLAVYLIEFAAFYALAFAATYFIDSSKAEFQAGLALFFLFCACLVGRPLEPHYLIRALTRPSVLLMSVVVLGFGVFVRREPDLTVLAPGLGLCFLGAAFADRIERSRKKQG
jgi:hypothetical protein